MTPNKRLVLVVWVDAHTSSSTAYSEHEIPHSAIEVETVGWLLKEDEAGVSVANEYCKDSTYRGYTFVPKGLIKSIQDVVKAKKARKKPTQPTGQLSKPLTSSNLMESP